MTETETLIEGLSRAVPRVSRRSAVLWMLLYLAVGAFAAIIVLALTVGVRPDLDVAMLGPMFWIKAGYTGGLGLVALLGLVSVTRPEAKPPRWLWLAAAPVAVLALIAIVDAAAMEKGKWMASWLGSSWFECPPLIAALALPIAVTLLWALRPFAPTQLRATGALAGTVAGALSAMIYCLHCPEAGAAFVLTWYTLGIGLVAGIGALIGPRLLRW
jgi:hypothetical protein